jgi:hypothetical protein
LTWRNGNNFLQIGVTGRIAVSMSDAITQDRSPRSPGLTLGDAINLTAKLFDAIRTATVAPDIAVRPLGYGGTNGAAMGTLATLAQYGLIDRSGGKVTITPLAVRILHPKGEDQRESAIREAALFSKVMKELYDGYLDCAESVIAGHLIQSGFNTDRAKRVAAIHVANKAFAKLGSTADQPDSTSDAGVTDAKKESPLTSAPAVVSSARQPPLPVQITSISALTPANPNKVLAQYTIPLGSNQATLVFTGNELSTGDFDELIEFVQFSKRQFERAQKSTTKPQYPKQAVWKNKENDMPVTITGVMGEQNGVLYYQSSTGTGIPANELEF